MPINQSKPRVALKGTLSSVCLTALILTGCGPKPFVLRTPSSVAHSSFSVYPELKRRIDSLLPDSLFPPSNAGIVIYSITRDEPLYELNPDLLFTPASNQKLLTAAAALHSLGTGYRFRTEVFIDSAIITIRGSGDPLMTFADIDSIAHSVTPLIDTTEAWLLRGDVSRFDTTRWGKGWMWDDAPGDYVMEVSPLSVDHNAIEIGLKAGERTGELVHAFAIPHTRYASVTSSSVTNGLATTDTIIISRSAAADGNRFHVSGVLQTGRIVSRRVSVISPERYFLTLLSERLEEQGARISGTEVSLDATSGEAALRFDRSLDTVLTFMNRESDNLAAENLFRLVGYHRYGRSTTADESAEAIRAALWELGVDSSGVIIADGSGVSRYNLVSASRIVALLKAVSARPEYFRILYESLPAAGVNGTLEKRMRGTPAQGNVRAKTGTINSGSALSGYLRAPDGDLIAFSVIMQNYPVPARGYRAVQDSIGVLLSRLEREGY